MVLGGWKRPQHQNVGQIHAIVGAQRQPRLVAVYIYHGSPSDSFVCIDAGYSVTHNFLVNQCFTPLKFPLAGLLTLVGPDHIDPGV